MIFKFNHNLLKLIKLSTFFGLIMMLVLTIPLGLHASMTSTNYTIEADSLNSGGTFDSTSTNFQLYDTLGELAIGSSTSTNFEVQSGFQYMIRSSLAIVLDNTSLSLGTLRPGLGQDSTTSQTLIAVTTDSPAGYTLSTNKDAQLVHTDDATVIDDHIGSIASPTAFSATDIGFGFTVVSSTNKDTSQWGSGTAHNSTTNNYYAAFPTSSTEILNISTVSNNVDNTGVGYRVIIPFVQKTGSYTGTVRYTATINL